MVLIVMAIVIFILGDIFGAFLMVGHYQHEIHNMKSNHQLEISNLQLKHAEQELATIKHFREELENFKAVINVMAPPEPVVEEKPKDQETKFDDEKINNALDEIKKFRKSMEKEKEDETNT